jgi:hypothetical protein
VWAQAGGDRQQVAGTISFGSRQQVCSAVLVDARVDLHRRDVGFRIHLSLALTHFGMIIAEYYFKLFESNYRTIHHA